MTRKKPLSLDTIRTVVDRERQSDSLQDLPYGFWSDVEEYLQIHREDVQETLGADADKANVDILVEEWQTATDLLETLADQRRSKLLDRAQLAASGMPVDTEAMTESEADAYDDLVDELETIDFIGVDLDLDLDLDARTLEVGR
jgi:DNA replication initiation complex subunit (GINS family)